MAINNSIKGYWRRSVGVTTGSKWKGRGVIKTKSDPTNPRTALQVGTRGAFGCVSTYASIMAPKFKFLLGSDLKNMSYYNKIIQLNSNFIDYNKYEDITTILENRYIIDLVPLRGNLPIIQPFTSEFFDHDKDDPYNNMFQITCNDNNGFHCNLWFSDFVVHASYNKISFFTVPPPSNATNFCWHILPFYTCFGIYDIPEGIELGSLNYIIVSDMISGNIVYTSLVQKYLPSISSANFLTIHFPPDASAAFVCLYYFYTYKINGHIYSSDPLYFYYDTTANHSGTHYMEHYAIV